MVYCWVFFVYNWSICGVGVVIVFVIREFWVEFLIVVLIFWVIGFLVEKFLFWFFLNEVLIFFLVFGILVFNFNFEMFVFKFCLVFLDVFFLNIWILVFNIVWLWCNILILVFFDYSFLENKIIYLLICCYNKVGLISIKLLNGVKIFNCFFFVRYVIVEVVFLFVIEYDGRDYF